MSDNLLIPAPEEQAEQILEELRENFDVSDDIEPEHLVELIDPVDNLPALKGEDSRALGY